MAGKIRRTVRKNTGNEFVDALMAWSDTHPLQHQNVLTTEIAKKIYPMYGAEKVKDPIVPLKLFNPTGDQTWYIWEINTKENLAFGVFTNIDGAELGYFDLDELRNVRGRFGLGIERDQHFHPTPLSELQKKFHV